MFEFGLYFHWSLFLWVQLTISQHWLAWRQAIIWTNADPVHWRIHASLGLNELNALNIQYRGWEYITHRLQYTRLKVHSIHYRIIYSRDISRVQNIEILSCVWCGYLGLSCEFPLSNKSSPMVSLTWRQLMDWCSQATRHYLSQCWHRSLSPNGVSRPQCVQFHGFFFFENQGP